MTGLPRRKQTPWTVRFGDTAARWCITIGGIGTIVAVTAVFVFLLYVVAPLFLPAKITQARSSAVLAIEGRRLRTGVDQYGVIGWTLSDDGVLSTFRPDTGELLERRPLKLAKGKITAAAFSSDSPDVALGFEDGSVRLGTIKFQTTFIPTTELPEELRKVLGGERAAYKGGIAMPTPQGQVRLQQVEFQFKDAVPAATAPIVLIDSLAMDNKSIFCVLTGDNKLLLEQVTERKNLLTDEVVLKTRKSDLPYRPREGKGPSHLRLVGRGENVLVAWDEGEAVRFDVRSLSEPVVAEQFDMLPDPAARITAIEPLLGRRTLMVGDSLGGVTAWFGTRRNDARTSDGIQWFAAHQMPRGAAAVTSLGASQLNRMLLAGYADGQARLFQVNVDKTMVATALGSEPILQVAISPQDDRLYALSEQRLWTAALDPKYPEVSWDALVRPIWYEDYPGPQHAWQSTGGTADFEPKLGIMPLVFGTLKATFYSMLFGAPLALLAAVYASEFMHPRWRARVKPTIELMASLPSVVLGFLAGNVIAQLVQGVVPQVLTTFVTVPLTILLGAFLWQLMPQRRTLMWHQYRFPLIGLIAIPAGIASGWLLGPLVERLFFAGNMMRWLDGQIGSGFAAWILLLLPLSGLTTAVVIGLFVNPWLARLSVPSRAHLAWANLLKFFLGTVAALLLAVGLSLLLTYGGNWAFGGLDPRGTFVSTYVQRNALVVGVLMGFAIIPIIYTIAEDALSTVPDHLRSASLGSGATQWQTAVRIVVPTAMSGLFSALMIGLGRAVGETMIVLMAAGNTPIMKMNIFDGFRTLSANIAVEMPEAAQNSAHYRILFLTGLTLFLMTFVVNTAAELVRIRFRRRSYQL